MTTARNVVLASLENRFADQCVDIFIRPDGTFGFEEFRRDPEDCGQWRNLDRFSHLSFSTQEKALEAAHENVPWLEKRFL